MDNLGHEIFLFVCKFCCGVFQRIAQRKYFEFSLQCFVMEKCIMNWMERITSISSALHKEFKTIMNSHFFFELCSWTIEPVVPMTHEALPRWMAIPMDWKRKDLERLWSLILLILFPLWYCSAKQALIDYCYNLYTVT